jgi:2-(1,2-epoxy-1,2-dihydrophenyl)acetyl-CoA isomerase
MLTNRRLTAAEALEWGLVNEVVDDSELPARLDQLADDIASGAGRSNATVKKLLLATFNNGIETQMELEGRFIAENADGADGREGVDAFLNKRAPKFA